MKHINLPISNLLLTIIGSLLWLVFILVKQTNKWINGWTNVCGFEIFPKQNLERAIVLSTFSHVMISWEEWYSPPQKSYKSWFFKLYFCHCDKISKAKRRGNHLFFFKIQWIVHDWGEIKAGTQIVTSHSVKRERHEHTHDASGAHRVLSCVWSISHTTTLSYSRNPCTVNG